MKRETFGSRLGFLLVSAGCAIGIGNVWKFPFITGLYGGGVFVLFYLLFLIIMGAPVLTMELAVGRASRRSAVQGYQVLEKPGQKWHIHGWFCIIGCALLMTSMPTFWLAMMLVLYFSLKLKLLPAMGVQSWRHFILPAIANASATTASLLRMTRSTMLEVIRQDYIRTARAKGAKENTVIFGHALRNALLPVVTLIGVNFGAALSGTIVIEQVFAIPGLGQLMVNAIRTKDTPMIIASLLFTAIIASLVNLLVDILYAYIDPRLKAKFSVVKRKKVSA